MTNFSEKRDFLRMAIDCQLSFAKKGEAQSLEGHVVNLSSKGILFTATDKYEVGEQLDIVLTPANSCAPQGYHLQSGRWPPDRQWA